MDDIIRGYALKLTGQEKTPISAKKKGGRYSCPPCEEKPRRQAHRAAGREADTPNPATLAAGGKAEGAATVTTPAAGAARPDEGATPPAVVYRVLVDGEDFDPFCPSATFCDLANAEYQAACLTEVDGIEPERIEIAKEGARW